jgi:hypothetical protein
MRHDLRAHDMQEDASTDHILWWPPTKIAGRYLSAYIAADEERERGMNAGPGVTPRAVIAPLAGPEYETLLRGYEFVTR